MVKAVVLSSWCYGIIDFIICTSVSSPTLDPLHQPPWGWDPGICLL